MKKSDSQPWALVLSGGGAKGLAHPGVIRGLEAAGFPKPSLVVGCSMGAIVGGLYACGMPVREIIHFVLNKFHISDYLDSFTFRIQGPMGKVFQTGQVLASLATRPGIDTGARVLDLLEQLTLGKHFNETEIPFRCNAVDLLDGHEIVFRTGSVAKAIRASMSFPVFFEPYHYRGKYFVDGGLWDNMPVAVAYKEGFKKVLAVSVNEFITIKKSEITNGPQVIYRSLESVLFSQNTKKRVPAGLTLYVADESTPLSFMRQKELIDLGEKVVVDNMENLKAFFDAAVPSDEKVKPPAFRKKNKTTRKIKSERGEE